MLLDNKIEISWNNATSKWYIDKGYKFTKIRDIFVVNVNDIIPTSTIKVNVKCDYCGKTHKKEYRKYISGREVVKKDCCSSKKCLAVKTKEINLKLYGVENCMQINDIKDKVSESFRTPFEEVISICNQKGLDLLSNSADYKNDRSRLKVICRNHIDKGIQDTNLANIKKSKYCCFYGGAEETGKSKRLDFGVVFNKFIELDYTPLFSEEDYTSNAIKLKFICNKHKNKGEQFTRYATIQQGYNGCEYCVRESIADKLRLSQEFIFNEFENRGLKVLDGQEYKNKDQPIKYICRKHPNIIQQASYSNLKSTNQPCDICRNEESVSSLNKRFRSIIHKWRKDTEIKDGYKCILTDSNIYDIHHLYPFNEIIKESLDTLNIKPDTNDGIEIEELKNEVIKLHNHYGLGVCIHPRLHSIFHSKYGKNATKEDFEEFKNNYINGKYKEFIDIK